MALRVVMNLSAPCQDHVSWETAYSQHFLLTQRRSRICRIHFNPVFKVGNKTHLFYFQLKFHYESKPGFAVNLALWWYAPLPLIRIMSTISTLKEEGNALTDAQPYYHFLSESTKNLPRGYFTTAVHFRLCHCTLLQHSTALCVIKRHCLHNLNFWTISCTKEKGLVFVIRKHKGSMKARLTCQVLTC